MITPRVLKGFRDYLPELMIQKKEIINKLENIFENYGFSPIDTPALEYTEILLGKGSGETDKQIYRFDDHGGRDVSLRFDLTVPLARFVSLNYDKLIFPFKGYHIAPVWRGENTQKGRFREFFQCDFDILGTQSIESDIEILLIIKSGMVKLNIGDFRINVNNRRILNSLLKKLDLLDKSVEILRTIDKIYKIGKENVIKELVDNSKIDTKKIESILDSLNIDNNKNKILGEMIEAEIFVTLENLKTKLGNEYIESINETEYIFNTFKKLGILKHFSFNPAITRGLDYYTGVVFETFILNNVDFGSICSGGRYDNLVGLYSKNVVPGVGGSFGLDRLLALMESHDLFNKKSSNSDILIFNIDSENFAKYFDLAETFRSNKVNAEVFYENKKIAQQFKYAENKSIKYVLFAGNEEFNSNKFNLKDIKTGEEKKSLTIDEIIKIIKK